MKTIRIELPSGAMQLELIDERKRPLYKASFTDGSFFYVTRARSFEGDWFWTSIPQGRQEIAAAIGAAIDARSETRDALQIELF